MDALGLAVGLRVGLTEGTKDGDLEGVRVEGTNVGRFVGSLVDIVGLTDDGRIEGLVVGPGEGLWVGLEGKKLGVSDGA